VTATEVLTDAENTTALYKQSKTPSHSAQQRCSSPSNNEHLVGGSTRLLQGLRDRGTYDLSLQFDQLLGEKRADLNEESEEVEPPKIDF
jgi:hypothetical protein